MREGGDEAVAVDGVLGEVSNRLDEAAAIIGSARGQIDQVRAEGRAGLAGMKPPINAEAVRPYGEAAKAYLEEAVRLFEGDGPGLARKMKLSVYALRRLLNRHGVKYPSRPQRKGASKRSS